ncbi:hypothetical protein ACHAPJ_006615 [Fusarium lateritium]
MPAGQKLLDGLVALVTGGGSGFGEGIATLFAEEGAKVVILDINQPGGERVTADIQKAGHNALFIKTDVTKAENWNSAVEMAIAEYGKIDVLVNNAGWTYRNKDTLSVPESEYNRIFDINVKSIFHSVNATMPHFLKQGSGSIINIGSCVVMNPSVGLAYYNATKGAVDMLTRSLAAEFSPKGVRVNGILPSLGNTALVQEFLGKDLTGDIVQDKSRASKLGRMVTPRDIAKGCLFFASPFFNEFQTGGLLRVDGGEYV